MKLEFLIGKTGGIVPPWSKICTCMRVDPSSQRRVYDREWARLRLFNWKRSLRGSASFAQRPAQGL